MSYLGYVRNIPGYAQGRTIIQGKSSVRPLAGFENTLFIDVETKTIYRDNGSTWDLLTSGGGIGIAGSGLTLSGSTFNVGTASTSRIVVNADNIDLATTGVTPGTYNSVTVDTYGRITAGSTTTLNFTGGTLTSPLILAADPTTNLGAATKQYVDTQITASTGGGVGTAGSGLTLSGSTFNIGTASTSRIVVNADDIDLATTGVTAGTYNSVTVDTYGRITAGSTVTTTFTGGTLTSPLILAADPTTNLGAATKQYVDTQITASTSRVLSAKLFFLSQM